MQIRSFILFLLFTRLSYGNPIVGDEHGTTYEAEKISENCIVQLGAKTSRVSCLVEYKLVESKITKDSYYLLIGLPIFLNYALEGKGEELLNILDPRIEIDGKIHEPDYGPAFPFSRQEEISFPSGVEPGFFIFMIDLGLDKKEANILVSYNQPTIDGSFLYLPLFEGGHSGKKHRMDIVPQEHLDSFQVATPIKDMDAFNDRLVIYLKHLELITIVIPNKKE